MRTKISYTMSEFFLNMDAVNQEVEKAKKSGGSDKYFSRKDIPDNSAVDIRVIPPVRSLNGLAYIKRIRVWINNKPYLSMRTFGEPCFILDAYDQILKGTDQTLKALVTDDKNFSISEDYVLPILLLNPIYEGNVLQRVDVVDDKVKFFDCTWTFIKKLNIALSNRLYQNGTPLGLMDRVQGRNIQVNKEVKEKTNYDAIVWPTITEMPEKYYQNVPDVVQHLRDNCYQREYTEGMLNAYLFNSPQPNADLKWPKDSPNAQSNQAVVQETVQPAVQQTTAPTIQQTTPPQVVQQTTPPPTVQQTTPPPAPPVQQPNTTQQAQPAVVQQVVNPPVQPPPAATNAEEKPKSLLDLLNKTKK